MKESETPKMISDAETTTLPPAQPARPATERKPGRGFLARIGVVLLIVALALLVWYAVEVLLLVFAGILLAVFLRGLSVGLSRRTGLGENWSLAVVGLMLLLLICGAVWWLAPSVAAQADELRRSLPESLRQAESWLALTINNEG